MTGSTHAGMIAGFAAQDQPRRVLGIDGSATVEQTRAQIARIAHQTADVAGGVFPLRTPPPSSHRHAFRTTPNVRAKRAGQERGPAPAAFRGGR